MESDNHLHVFHDTVVPATCKEHGYTIHKCECGYEHKDNFTPLGEHSFIITEDIAPTCEEAGKRSYRCAVCGEEKTETVSALGHAWGEWNMQTFPTCTEKGTQIRVCANCGKQEVGELAAKGHKLTSPKRSETHKGYVNYFCEDCGQTVFLPSSAQKAKDILGRHKKVIIASLIAIVLAVGLFFAATEFLIPYFHYSRANSLIAEGNYNDAYSHLKMCENFKDSKELLKDFNVIFDERIVYTENRDVFDVLCKYEYEYDNNGNLIREIRYDKDGNVDWKYEYEYDNNGNLIREIHYDGDGNINYNYEYEYDKNSNVIREIHYDKDGNVNRKYEFEYDNNDNLIRNIHYDKDGNVNRKCEYEYDNNGNIICGIYYDRYGNVDLKYEYEYDNNGNLICGIYYDRYGNVNSEFEYEYDNNGNMTCQVSYDKDGNVDWKYEYEYVNIRIIYNPKT